MAEAYRSHRWWGSESNLRHGQDRQGVRVDTPDEVFLTCEGRAAGGWRMESWNVGVPYQWGGFDTLKAFDQKCTRGLAAGDLYTAAKRAGLEQEVSREATGIDCSGLVSRCWRLPRAYSTRDLPRLCTPLASLDELKAGDILNVHNAHVLLFTGWESPRRERLWVYETGIATGWKVDRQIKTRAWVEAGRYQPWRYRGIRDEG